LKITVGYAKNDILELTVGIILSIVGGILIGSIYGNPSWHLMLSGTVLFIGIGIILEIRVLAKHHYELQKVRIDIENARNQNTETLEKMEKQQGLINGATEKLNEATSQIDQAESEIEDIHKKSFSRYGSLTDSKSLEDDIQTFHERLQKVEEKLGHSSFLRRRLGRHRSA
jgi:septal ring factor EnvC (AmiA/AmiB activator)